MFVEKLTQRNDALDLSSSLRDGAGSAQRMSSVREVSERKMQWEDLNNWRQ